MCALIFRGSRCAICSEPFEDGQGLFATSGVFLPKSDPLWRYCDAAMHWDCYAGWSERPRFARAYHQRWIGFEPVYPHWSTIHLDDALIVTINPDPPVEEVRLHLADTGTTQCVKLVDWASWIDGDAWSLDAEHAVVRDALEPLVPLLRKRFPTADHLVRAVDVAARAALIDVAEEREDRRKATKQQERTVALKKIAADNVVVSQLHRDLNQGQRSCPRCELRGAHFLLNDGGTSRRSFIVCPGCARSFAAEDFARDPT